MINRIQFGGDEVVKAKGESFHTLSPLANTNRQMELDLPLSPWLKVCLLLAFDWSGADPSAGAEFADFVLQAAFGGKKVKTVQAYIDLEADAGGKSVQKEIESDLGYFSVNIELGVSPVQELQSLLPYTTPLTCQPNGIEKILPIGQLDSVEKELLSAAVKELGPSIEKVCLITKITADAQGASFQPAKL